MLLASRGYGASINPGAVPSPRNSSPKPQQLADGYDKLTVDHGAPTRIATESKHSRVLIRREMASNAYRLREGHPPPLLHTTEAVNQAKHGASALGRPAGLIQRRE
jgi:hypothetical protein